MPAHQPEPHQPNPEPTVAVGSRVTGGGLARQRGASAPVSLSAEYEVGLSEPFPWNWEGRRVRANEAEELLQKRWNLWRDLENGVRESIGERTPYWVYMRPESARPLLPALRMGHRVDPESARLHGETQEEAHHEHLPSQPMLPPCTCPHQVQPTSRLRLSRLGPPVPSSVALPAPVGSTWVRQPKGVTKSMLCKPATPPPGRKSRPCRARRLDAQGGTAAPAA